MPYEVTLIAMKGERTIRARLGGAWVADVRTATEAQIFAAAPRAFSVLTLLLSVKPGEAVPESLRDEARKALALASDGKTSPYLVDLLTEKGGDHADG